MWHFFSGGTLPHFLSYWSPAGASRRGRGGEALEGRLARVGRRARLEPAPQPQERAVERDLDRVRPETEDLADPPRAEVGAVAEGDQLLLPLLEGRDRRREREPPDRPL